MPALEHGDAADWIPPTIVRSFHAAKDIVNEVGVPSCSKRQLAEAVVYLGELAGLVDPLDPEPREAA